jgi:hypothetical protein
MKSRKTTTLLNENCVRVDFMRTFIAEFYRLLFLRFLQKEQARSKIAQGKKCHRCAR